MKLSLETLPLYCTEEGECLLWNLGTNGVGYPIARLDGKGQGVRRYVYRLSGGVTDSRRWMTSRCGHKLCVAPGCIWPRKIGAVISEGYKNGSRHPAKEAARGRAGLKASGWQILSMEKAREIRGKRGKKPAELAVEYGVCVDTIRKINRGAIWPEPSPFDQLLRHAA